MDVGQRSGEEFTCKHLILRTCKALATRYLHAAGATDFAWQRNYHEHITRKEGNLDGIRQYIIDNPIRWTKDELFQEKGVLV